MTTPPYPVRARSQASLRAAAAPNDDGLSSSRHAAGAAPNRRRAARAQGADRGRGRRPAGRLDRHVGAGPRLASRQARRRGSRGERRRGRQSMVHARRRKRPGAPDRGPYRLGPERRLARRMPERPRRRRGSPPDCLGGAPAGHRPARELGRRGGCALRPLALRLQCRSRVDVGPGRAPAAPGRERHRAARCPAQSTASTSTGRSTRGPSSKAPPPTSSFTSSKGPVLESMEIPLGVVLGTFGVERHQVTFRGQAAHAGSTPMDRRRDASGAAAKLGARDPRDREADRRRRGLHDGQRRHEAGDRHLRGRDGRVPPRSAPPGRGQARRHARRGERGRRRGSQARKTSTSSGSGSGRSSRSSSTRS